MPLIQTSESAQVSFSPHASFKYRTTIKDDTIVNNSQALRFDFPNFYFTEIMKQVCGKKLTEVGYAHAKKLLNCIKKTVHF